MTTDLLEPIVAPVVHQYRSVERLLGRHAVTRAFGVVPRTTGFALRTVQRRARPAPVPGLPQARLTPRLLGSVALDEAILTMAMAPDRFPRRSDYERVGAELREAHELYAARGWIDDPASYHRRPPDLAELDVQTTRGWAHGLGYDRIWFPSEFEPRPDEPARDRWLGFVTNRTAGAWVLRHDDGPTPRTSTMTSGSTSSGRRCRCTGTARSGRSRVISCSRSTS
jgi:hypothetical protein